MKCDLCGGTVVDREVSYTIEFEGRLHIVEHVPAKNVYNVEKDYIHLKQ